VQDPYAVEPQRLRVEGEPLEPRGGARERSPLHRPLPAPAEH
jgi:hypothetical protein